MKKLFLIVASVILMGSQSSLSMVKGLQNGFGRKECHIVWDDLYQGTL